MTDGFKFMNNTFFYRQSKRLHSLEAGKGVLGMGERLITWPRVTSVRKVSTVSHNHT